MIILKMGRRVEKAEKDQAKDEMDENKVKKDEASDDEDLDDAVQRKEEAESVEVRDVSYNLENLVINPLSADYFEHLGMAKPYLFKNLFKNMGSKELKSHGHWSFHKYPILWNQHKPRKQLAMKERNLKLRNVTWVFHPDPRLIKYSMVWFALNFPCLPTNMFSFFCLILKVEGE